MDDIDYVTSADGTAIAFERHGSSEPVVILVEPPLHHRAMSAYSGLVPLLAERLTVITYDRRGRGDSGDNASYQPERETEDLAAIIDAVGGSVGVYGYSAGALLALHAAAKITRIAGLVVLEPPLHDDSDARPDPLTIELGELITNGDRAGAVRRFHEAIGVPAEFIDEMAADTSWPSMIDVAHTAVYDCMISDAINSNLLAGVSAPTLVLDSAGSTDDLAGSAATVAALLPNATHRSLPGQWHTVADDLLAPVIIDHITASLGQSRR